jgi:hypothetical protein
MIGAYWVYSLPREASMVSDLEIWLGLSGYLKRTGESEIFKIEGQSIGV